MEASALKLLQISHSEQARLKETSLFRWVSNKRFNIQAFESIMSPTENESLMLFFAGRLAYNDKVLLFFSKVNKWEYFR